MAGFASQGLWEVARRGWRREPPERYLAPEAPGPELFLSRVASALAEGTAVLDIGAGAEPVVPVGDRPPRCAYVGLDVSAAELDRAPEGSYDETVVADAATPQPALESRFDLVISRFVLEHVDDLERTLAVMRGYLRPGGRLLAYLSGRNSPASALNRVLPESVAATLVVRLTGRDRESIHPARYDRCTYNGLRAALGAGWADLEVVPCYSAEKYFRFSRPVHAAYCVYEELAYRAQARRLASHYLIDATRAGDQ